MNLHQVFIRFFFVFFFTGSLQLKAQEITPDDSFTFDLCLPNALSNAPFQKIMQGLVHASTHYQYALSSGLYIGAGAHYSYLAINEFRVQPKVYGGIHSGAVFLKAGQEKFWSERFGTDIGLRAGWVRSYVVSDALEEVQKSPQIREGLYIEPNISLILTSDVNQSFRLCIGYPIYGYAFSPQLIGIEGNMGYDLADFEGNSSYLSVGFGYTYYFNGKKSTVLED
ncbi:MAG: hypothetical protein LW839_06730 [Cryomorphaceae bacterium]|jgi:hypothetical protein|nr:hypothetical protein [Cryomorphaceae bacterium]